MAGATFSLAGNSGSADPMPPVSAAAAEIRPAPSPPLEILARLPVTRDALELPTYLPAEIPSGRLYEMVDVSRGSSIPP